MVDPYEGQAHIIAKYKWGNPFTIMGYFFAFRDYEILSTPGIRFNVPIMVQYEPPWALVDVWFAVGLENSS